MRFKKHNKTNNKNSSVGLRFCLKSKMAAKNPEASWDHLSWDHLGHRKTPSPKLTSMVYGKSRVLSWPATPNGVLFQRQLLIPELVRKSYGRKVLFIKDYREI